MKLRIAFTSLLSMLLTSCVYDLYDDTDSDSLPIVFSATIQPKSDARVTVNNGWVDMYDNRIGISIDGETKEYVVSEIGELTSENPFYWNGRESVYAEAWFPYNDGVKTEVLWVYADQRIAENYEKSDYLEVLDTKVTPRRNKLVFKHRTSKVTCSYNASGDEQANARFVLHGLQGVNEGNSVMMNAKHRAIIVPQTIPVGADFIELILDEKDHYFYTMEEELSIEGGFSYHTDITLDEETGELDVIFSKPSSWEAEIEIPIGDSPTGDADGNGNGDKWTGDDENSTDDSHRWAVWVHDMVRKAAKNNLLMNIHDEFRPSGFSRTYPNLLTQEGICGNEEWPDATHNVTLPFTRMINGAADYTICYYDSRLKNTHAHQLAASLVFYSPLQTILWYDTPDKYQGEPEMEWFENLQTVFDESKVLDGMPGKNIVMARRKGNEWFVGAMTNNEGSTEKVDLSFLDKNRTYLAHIYTDGGEKVKTRTQVKCSYLLVDASQVLSFQLKPKGGAAIRLVPIDNQEAKKYKKYNGKIL